MPITSHVADDILFFVTTGDVTFEEGLRVLRGGLDAYALSRTRQGKILFDIRGSTERRSAEELRSITVIMSQHIASAKTAFLVKDNGLYFGLSRMTAAFMESVNYECAVFLTEDEALAWLRAAATG